MQTHAQAANITVEPYWPGLFAKLFAKKNMDDLITNVGAGVCGSGRLGRAWVLHDCCAPGFGRAGGVCRVAEGIHAHQPP